MLMLMTDLQWRLVGNGANDHTHPNCMKGVLNVAASLAYTTSHNANVVTLTPTAGPCTAAINVFGKSMKDDINAPAYSLYHMNIIVRSACICHLCYSMIHASERVQ